MARNKFATILHRRKTNKITLVLIYALLEWILICLLLLNALFSYFITKFANYFGLKSPCLLCSRIDHILDKKGSTNSYNELICQKHGIEISKLGYCSSHRKLVEPQRGLCEDCLSAMGSDSIEEESGRRDGSVMEVLRWLEVVKDEGKGEDRGNGEVDVRCCCCDEIIIKPVIQTVFGVDHRVCGLENRNLDSIEEEEEEEEEEEGEEEEDVRDDDELDQNRVISVSQDGKEVSDEEADNQGIVTNRELSFDTLLENTNLKNEETSEGFNAKFGYEILDADDEDIVMEAAEKGEDTHLRNVETSEGFDAKFGYEILDADDEDFVMEATEKEPLLQKDSLLPPPPPPPPSVVDDRDPPTDERILPQHLEFYIDNYDYRLVPVLDFGFTKNTSSKGKNPVDEGVRFWDREDKDDYKISGSDVGIKAADFVLESCELGVNNKNKSSIELLNSRESEENFNSNNNQVEEKIETEELQFHSYYNNNQSAEAAAPGGDDTPLNETMPAGTDELQSSKIPSVSSDQDTYPKTINQTDRQPESLEENFIDVTRNAETLKEAPAAAAELTDQTQPREVENPSYEILPTTTVSDPKIGTEATVTELVSMDDLLRQSNDILHQESQERTDEMLLTDVILSTVFTNAVAEARVETVVTELAPADIHSAPDDTIFTQNGHAEDDVIQVEEPSTSCKVETPTLGDEEISNNCLALDAEDNTNVPNCQVTEETEQCRTVNIKERTDGEQDRIELDSEKVPDTPTSIDETLHNKTLLVHRDSESLDGGSIISEPEVNDTNNPPTTVIESLKSALIAERKALKSLYTELEEERNAAAIAANQTLAMINRLQEERAAIEMEASQYQRMMEEQSEYDQEALQMMNELVTKREKEKEELEREVEVYRKKLMEYEERERIRILRRRDGSCSRSRRSSSDNNSFSNGDEGTDHELSCTELISNIEVKEEDGCCKQQQVVENDEQHDNTPVDAVLNLKESLSIFEDERMSILEQLKALEEKLVDLAGEEEQHMDSMQPFDIFCEENANQFDKSTFEYTNGTSTHREENGGTVHNGHMMQHNTNGHHEEASSEMSTSRRVNGSHPKQLLPLFDATEFDYSEELDGNNHIGKDYSRSSSFDHNLMLKSSSPVTKFELEKKRLVIEEEMDHVYDRLQALEADREFVKHCVGSLRKGDKGVNLLQEILQHLRDLKNVEMKSRMSMDDAVCLAGLV